MSQFQATRNPCKGGKIKAWFNTNREQHNTSQSSPLSVAPTKSFKRSHMFQKDIAILQATYVLEGQPAELKAIIILIVAMHSKDAMNRVG